MRGGIVLGSLLFGVVAMALSCGDDEPTGAPADGGAPDGRVDASEAGSRDAGDGAAVGECEASDGGAGDTRWLTDDSLWEPLDGLDVCGVHRARLPSALLPKRKFCACGDGCRVTAGSLEGSAGISSNRGWFDDKATYVRLGSRIANYDVRDVLDVTNNVTMSAVEARKAKSPEGFARCTDAPGAGPLGPSLVESWFVSDRTDSSGMDLVDIYYARSRYRETSTFDVMRPWVPSPAFDEGRVANTGTEWGYLDKHSPNELHATADWDAGFPLPTVVPKDGQEDFVELTAWDSTFAWHSDERDHGNLYAWSSAAGGRVVAQRPKRIMSAAIGSSGLVWIEAGTQNVPDSGDERALYSNMQLWWIANLSAPTPTKVAEGFGLPNEPGVVTGDGYAAFVSCPADEEAPLRPGDCPLVVVQLSTNKVWKLAQPSSGTFWTGVFVVNQRELVVAENSQVAFVRRGAFGRRFFVLETPKLDALVARFAAR